MRYKTLFRVGLKLLGVYFFFTALVALASAVSNYIWQGWINTPAGGVGVLISGSSSNIWFWHASTVLELFVGLYLFFGGKWIVDRAIPGNRPYCHECGYDLTNAIGNVCTECGTPFRSQPLNATAVASE